MIFSHSNKYLLNIDLIPCLGLFFIYFFELGMLVVAHYGQSIQHTIGRGQRIVRLLLFPIQRVFGLYREYDKTLN